MVELHPQLQKDTVHLVRLELSDVYLQTDANYPWLVLVPQLEGAREIHKLSPEDQQQLMKEISFVSERLEALTGADKMNVAMLGNMVPQLHIHIVARFIGDPAWPGPIWGIVERKPYGVAALADIVIKLKEALI